jgi:hypothetical protein
MPIFALYAHESDGYSALPSKQAVAGSSPVSRSHERIQFLTGGSARCALVRLISSS